MGYVEAVQWMLRTRWRAARCPALVAVIAGLAGCGDSAVTSGSATLPDPGAKSPLAGVVQVPARTALMRADGGGPHRIFADVDGRTDGLPAWSPDGTRIAFTRCDVPDDLRLRLVPRAVWTVAPNGSGAARRADHAFGSAWSPDGSWIVYSTDTDTNGELRTGEDESAYAAELYLKRPDGSARTRLTRTGTVGEASPSWSPDGAWITYARTGWPTSIRPSRFSALRRLIASTRAVTHRRRD